MFGGKEGMMYKRIMVPLDGSELAERVLPHVNTFVSAFPATSAVLVRVVEPSPSLFDDTASISSTSREKMIADIKQIDEKRKLDAAAYLDGVIQKVTSEGGKFTSVVLSGRVAERLAEYIEKQDMDLVIIATHGRSGISRWVRGSIAERVLTASRCPVLLVRPESDK